MKQPCEYERHTMGDGRRFHVRIYDLGKFEVYGFFLDHICDCQTFDIASMIANALENQAAAEDVE